MDGLALVDLPMVRIGAGEDIDTGIAMGMAEGIILVFVRATMRDAGQDTLLATEVVKAHQEAAMYIGIGRLESGTLEVDQIQLLREMDQLHQRPEDQPNQMMFSLIETATHIVGRKMGIGIKGITVRGSGEKDQDLQPELRDKIAPLRNQILTGILTREIVAHKDRILITGLIRILEQDRWEAELEEEA